MKECFNCHQVKEEKEFHLRKNKSNTTYRNQCKKYTSKKQLLYFQTNKEKVRQEKSKHYKKFREKIRQKSSQRYRENRNELLQKAIEYYNKNKEKVSKRNSKFRKIHILRAMAKSVNGYCECGNKITAFDLWKIAKRQKMKCALSGKQLTRGNISCDHISPRSKGGLNISSNIQLVDFDLNLMKSGHKENEFIQLCWEIVDFNFSKLLNQKLVEIIIKYLIKKEEPDSNQAQSPLL